MVKIMVVGAADLARGALVSVFSQQPGWSVAAEQPLDPELVATVRRTGPDVLVVYADREGTAALAAVRRLAVEAPRCRVALLTGERSGEWLRAVLDAGVWALVDTDISPAELVAALDEVIVGERVITPAFARAALEPTGSQLTEHERSALLAVEAGHSTGEIAERLRLSPGTVRNYLSAAMRKTGARTRLEAVRLARQVGWL